MSASWTRFSATELESVGVADGWPYGPNARAEMRRRLVAWASVRDLRLARPRTPCLHWLTGQVRRCAALRDRRHPGVLLDVDLRANLDHRTFWTRYGAPALLLAQPYGNPDGPGFRAWVAEIERDWPVKIEITGAPWYTFADYGVQITPTGAVPRRPVVPLS